jgi:hypothetical protein
MKRFLPISILLHGGLFLLLFAWEIRGGPLWPRQVIQVILRAETEKPAAASLKAGPGAKRREGARKAANEGKSLPEIPRDERKE